MAELVPGIYEHVITPSIQHRLRTVNDDLIQRRRLDQEGAVEALARQLGELTRRALRLTSERTNGDRVASLVDVANRIAAVIATIVPDAMTDRDIVSDESEVLLA